MRMREAGKRVGSAAALAAVALGVLSIFGMGGVETSRTRLSVHRPRRTRLTRRTTPVDIFSSARQREGRLRNGSEELAGIFLSDGDVDPLAAFLRSLNEDYN